MHFILFEEKRLKFIQILISTTSVFDEVPLWHQISSETYIHKRSN